MYTLTRKGDVHHIRASALEGLDFLIHAFCTRHKGLSQGAYASMNIASVEGDDPQNIRQNWRLLSRAFAIDVDHFFVLHQVHEDGIFILDRSFRGGPFREPPACDAVITDQAGWALCVKTADCVPIFLVDPCRRIIANVHAGWKGTALNIMGKVIGTMSKRFGSRIGEIIAVIGPAIGACCYEVDERVIRATAPWNDVSATRRSASEEDRWMLDLPLINHQQAVRAGIPDQNISLINLCTSCREDLFFSHRRDHGRTGRQVHFVMLKDPAVPAPKNT
jgi:YfiH family protein